MNEYGVMVHQIQPVDLSLHQVEAMFQLEQTWELDFFPEWQNTDLSSIGDFEKRWLDQIKNDFLRLAKYQTHEEIVDMYVLAPLLSLAGLTSAPFVPVSKHRVEVVVCHEENTVIRGNIDLIILIKQFWVIVIEAKRQSISVTEALPKLLLSMMKNTDANQHVVFGFILNGNEFLFLKLVHQMFPTYAVSRLFSLLNPGNDLYDVLAILRVLKAYALMDRRTAK